MIKACIFDLDGTLLYTIPSLQYVLNRTLEQFHLAPVTEEQVAAFIGNGARTLVERSLAANGVQDSAMTDAAYAYYREIFADNATRDVKPYAGIPETLKELKDRGFALAVISNKSQSGTEACIREFFGETLFDCVAGECPGIPLKPDPAALLLLAQGLGVKPKECLYIGDSEVDMAAGRNAGMQTCAAPWGYRSRETLLHCEPDHWACCPEDLIGIAEHRYDWVYEIDGSGMQDVRDFYRAIHETMTFESEDSPGCNLDALADLLSGGFGCHGFGDRILLRWKHFTKAEEAIGAAQILRILKVLLERNEDYSCDVKLL